VISIHGLFCPVVPSTFQTGGRGYAGWNPSSVNAPNWFFALRRRAPWAQKGADKPASAAVTGLAEWVGADPFREGARRTSEPLAPNRSNLRLSVYARQAVVRVPKSNTKYGGNWGKPGGQAAPWLGSSISESKRIRKRKIFRGHVDICAAPALHRASFYSPLGLVLGTTQGPLRGGVVPSRHHPQT
jgi:hypothetical protein